MTLFSFWNMKKSYYLGIPAKRVRNINIIKTHGKSITESKLIDGYALESTRGGMGMPLTVKDAKIRKHMLFDLTFVVYLGSVIKCFIYILIIGILWYYSQTEESAPAAQKAGRQVLMEREV